MKQCVLINYASTQIEWNTVHRPTCTHGGVDVNVRRIGARAHADRDLYQPSSGMGASRIHKSCMNS
jgi:hypothetical protein